MTPPLDPESWRELQAHYDRIIDRGGEEHTQAVAELRRERPELAEQLRRLLAASDGAEARIRAVLDQNLEALAGEGGRQKLPERIGPYEVLRELGRGGMSVVYLARRADLHFRKLVAIKVVLRGMDFEEILRRLRQERQILAQLEHPNIARLLDGGNTEDGAPYVVMEFVDGQPIDTFCQTEALGLRGRLELFCQICEAVAHAHRNLVVHRDLKPSNVLVNGEGQVKLLDFGIAKLLDPEQALEFGKTADTMRLWTPSFASPEQIAGRGLNTASDIYSLGVLLCHLLCGRGPYDPGLGRGELERAIVAGRVRRPSEVADSPQDADGLRGDLDAIVAEATRRRPEDRYASAQNLAADVRRYLDGLPVLARRESALYPLWKFAGRHRNALAGTAVGGLLLVATLVFSALRLAHEKEVALAEREKAEHTASFLRGLFEHADPARSRHPELTARDLLDQGARRIHVELTEQPLVRADLMDMMGTVYQALGDYGAADRWLTRARDLRREHLDAEHPALLDSAEHLAALEHASGRYDAAQSALESVLERKKEVHGADSLEVATTLSRLGDLLYERGDTDRALGVFESAYGIRRRHFSEPHLELARSLQDLGATHFDLGQLDEAEDLLLRAEAQRRRELGDSHPKLAETLGTLGAVRFARGDVPQAEALLREALDIRTDVYGRRHPLVARTLNNLGEVLRRSGQYGEALPLLEESAELVGVLQGPGHPEYADNLLNYARTLQQAGRPAEAEVLQLKVLEILTDLGDEGERKTPWALINLGDTYRDLGEPRRALDSYRRALDLRRRHFPAGHPRLIRPLERLGDALLGLDPAAAEAPLREALDIRTALRPERLSTHRLRLKLAGLLADLEDGGPADGRGQAEALALAEDGLRGLEDHLEADDPEALEARRIVEGLRAGS
ncbi:MAG: serine/threonine-protein kinase [Acidobacteriota bacterium]